MKSLFSFLLLLFTSLLVAQSNRIFLDEDFSDWDNVPVAYTDAIGDGGSSGIDFDKIWISNDEDFLFLRFEVGKEINLQDLNSITLHMDTDNDASTGLGIDGIGAELNYSFGERIGTIVYPQNSLTIGHADIGLVSSPTVTSTQFELAIARDLSFFGEDLYKGNTVQIRFSMNGSSQDFVPNETGGIPYTFQDGPFDPLPSFVLDRPTETDWRLLSYNVSRDDFFENFLTDEYRRILQSIQPDIIGFQEIYDHSSQQTADRVEAFLPSANGEEWFHAKIDPDIILVSRFPILASAGTNPDGDGNGAFLLDMESLNGQKLMLVVAHPPCCDNNEARQNEMDAMLGFIRDVKNGVGAFSISQDDPIVVAGDMNLVGFRRQQETLLTGDILAEFAYGEDFNPDWDGTAFEDAKPFSTNLPTTTTWYSENSDFSPGRLDYIAYTGSVLDLENTYALFTPALSAADLANNNLAANDAVFASDHLPMVADFSFKITVADQNLETSATPSLDFYPNPLSDQGVLSIQLAEKSEVLVELFDLQGKSVAWLFSGEMPAGKNVVAVDGEGLVAGLYLCRMTTDAGVLNQLLEVLW